jgi:hypothetical protein
MLSLPFYFYGWRRGLFASVALISAFQVMAGSLGKIGPFDILIEDLLRYGVLAGLVGFNIVKKPR